MGSAIVRLAEAALDLLAPKVCLACGGGRQARVGLCAACLRHVPPRAAHPCPRCAGPLGPGVDAAACNACAALRPKFTAGVAAGPYARFLGELVRRSKYGHDPLLAVPLGGLMVEAVREWPGRDGLTAVAATPATKSRAKERGFHLADLLAERLADELRLPLVSARLARVGDPVPQAALPRTKRRRAAHGTVALVAPRGLLRPPRIEGHVVLVVDDVLTTGATANECAKVLLQGGAAEVRVAVCARA